MEVLQVEQILKEEFKLLKADLIKEYDILGMRASGNWANSIEEEYTSTSAKLIGEKYSEQLEFGRRAGKQPPSKAIEQWIRDKGLASRLTGKMTVSGLAFLIARKIAREGWKRERFGGVELISRVVTPDRIQKIIDRVSDYSLSLFSKEIRLMFEEIEA